MLPLVAEFTDRTFRYTQLARQDAYALYAQTHLVGGQVRYEVVRIRPMADHTWPHGATTPAHEVYPGAERWGRDGWTFFTRQAAEAHFQGLIATATEETDHVPTP